MNYFRKQYSPACPSGFLSLVFLLGATVTLVGQDATTGNMREKFVAELVADLNSDDLGTKVSAMAALSQLGSLASPAVDELLALVHDENEIVVYDAVTALGNIGDGSEAVTSKLREVAGDANTSSLLRTAAAKSLLELGDRDVIADLELVSFLVSQVATGDSLVSEDAALALTYVGTAAVEPLMGAMRSAKPESREALVSTMGMLGPRAEAAVPMMVRLLNARTTPVPLRLSCIRALSTIGVADDKVISTLKTMLALDSPQVKFAAMRSLGTFGESAGPAIDSIIEIAKSDDLYLRNEALLCLGAIGEGTDAVLETLLAAVKDDSDKSGTVRRSGIAALSVLGKEAREAIRELMLDPETAPLAMEAISRNTNQIPDEVLEELIAKTSDEAEEVRIGALLALASLGERAKDAVPALVKILGDPSAPNRAGVAYALGKIGALDAKPALKAAFMETDEKLRRASGFALVMLEPENATLAKAVVPQLASGLSNEWSLVRGEICLALAKLGPLAKSAVPKLVTLIDDESVIVQADALHALGEIGQLSDDVKRAVEAGLRSYDANVRLSAVYAFGALEIKDNESSDLIERLLGSADPLERTLAAWSLAKTKQPTEEMLSILLTGLEIAPPRGKLALIEVLASEADELAVKTALQKLLESPDEAVSAAAMQALRND